MTSGTGCAVPLVVGVMGVPEDAAAREVVRAMFGSILDEIRAAYPHTPVLVLATVTNDAPDPALDAARERELRTAQERTPARLSHFSDILVVFADAASPARDAETFAVVALRESGRASGQRRLLEPPEVATTYNVVLPRDGAAAEPLEVRRIYPHRFEGDRRSEADFAAAVARLDRFNADITNIVVPAGLLPSERLFIAADTAANDLQRRLFFWQRALYSIAFVAAAAQIADHAIGPGGPYLKVAAVVLTLAAFLVVRRSDYQNRYQDYRALGEGLRVQSAWTHAGVPDSVEASYLRMQQSELSWIRSALRTIGFLQSAVEDGRRDAGALRRWVDEQRKYFRAASTAQNRRKVRFGGIVTVLVPVNLAAGLLLLAGLSLPQAWYGGWLADASNRDGTKYYAGVFAGLAALVIAIVTSYMHTRAFSENANRYQRMFFLFDEAHRQLAESPEGDAAGRRELARELGREALAEHAEWLLSQRERPVSVVHTSAA